MTTKSNSRTLKLKSHEEYLIYRTYFIKQKNLIFKLNRKVRKGERNDKMTRRSKFKAFLLSYFNFIFRFSNAPGKSDDFEKRRSQAAIRAQAKKELEREEQAASAANKLRDTYSEKPLIECEVAPAGGSSVLYKCPLIGDQVLPKEEMRQAIKDFLYSQIEGEPGLTACLIIHTLNTDSEKVGLT